MGAAMYKQRPNIPALISAIICFLSGVLAVAGVQSRQDYVPGSSVVNTILVITILLTSILLIIAFARYRFSHLWKSTGASHSDKYKHSHRHGRNRHHRH